MRARRVQIEIVQAVAKGAVAWSFSATLAAALPSRNPGTIRREIDRLVRERVLVEWTVAMGRAITLSPLTAESLGLELVELDHREIPVWGKLDDEPLPRVSNCQRSLAWPDFLDAYTPPRSMPEIAAEAEPPPEPSLAERLATAWNVPLGPLRAKRRGSARRS